MSQILTQRNTLWNFTLRNVRMSGTTGWGTTGVGRRMPKALFGVLLVTLSACGGSVAGSPDGFINEPSTTLTPISTTTVIPTTTTVATTMPPPTSTVIEDEANAADANNDLIDESILRFTEPGTVEAEVETLWYRANTALDASVESGDAESSGLLGYMLPGPAEPILDYINRAEAGGETLTVEPATNRWIESLELAVPNEEGELSVAFLTFCELFVDTAKKDGEVVRQSTWSSLVEWQVFREADGWIVSTAKVNRNWEGEDGCVKSYS